MTLLCQQYKALLLTAQCCVQICHESDLSHGLAILKLFFLRFYSQSQSSVFTQIQILPSLFESVFTTTDSWRRLKKSSCWTDPISSSSQSVWELSCSIVSYWDIDIKLITHDVRLTSFSQLTSSAGVAMLIFQPKRKLIIKYFMHWLLPLYSRLGFIWGFTFQPLLKLKLRFNSPWDNCVLKKEWKTCIF